MRKMCTSMALAMVMGMAMAQTAGQSQTTAVRAPDGSIATFVKSNHVSWEDAAAALAIARSLNMDPSAVMTMRGTISAPYYALAPAYVMQHQSGKALSDIWTMYNGGMTWNQIANLLNVPATYYNPGNSDATTLNNDQFTEGVWQAMLQNNYGMTPADWSYFHTTNVPIREVVVGEVISRETNRPVRDIVTLYNGNSDWAMTDQRFSTDMGLANNGLDQSTSSASSGSSSTTNTQTMSTTTSNTNSGNGVSTGSNDASSQGSSNAGNSDVVNANHHTQTGAADSIKEWQVNGSDVNAYMSGRSSTQSSYGLSRHHRRSRRHSHRR